MAVVLDATPGSPVANAFATVAEADAYWDSQLYPDAWTGATTDTKTRALITATQLLTEQLVWRGYPASTIQALPFPRTGLLTRSGAVLPIGLIPTDLVHATAELAGQLIRAGQMPDTPLDSAGLKRVKAGPVELEFNGSASGEALAWLPGRVWALIGFLAETRAGATSVPLVRS